MLLSALHLKMSKISKDRLKHTSEVAEVERVGSQVRFDKVIMRFFSDFERFGFILSAFSGVQDDDDAPPPLDAGRPTTNVDNMLIVDRAVSSNC